MKRFIRRAAAFLLALCLLPSGLVQRACGHERSPLSISTWGKVNGLYISTASGGDFPSAPGLNEDQLKEELDAIVDFAADYGFNTIFFETVAQGGALYRSRAYGYSEALYTEHGFFSRLFQLDPLDYLTGRAAEKQIAVAAVIDPFSASVTPNPPDNRKSTVVKQLDHTVQAGGRLYFDPASRQVQKLLETSVKELAKKYPLSAIVLRDFAYPVQDFDLRTTGEEKQGLLTELLENLEQTAAKENSEIRLGLESRFTTNDLAQGGFQGYGDLIGWTQRDLVDFVTVSPGGSTSDGGYQQAADNWSALLGDGNTSLYTVNDASAALAPGEGQEAADPLELSCQLYVNNQSGLDGAVVSGYSLLTRDPSDIATNLSAAFAPQKEYPLNGVDLTIPWRFQITRPAETLYTSYSQFYIMGTAPGGQPVLFEGDEISQGRTFGVLAPLAQGENTFTFTCGEEEQQVTIYRDSYPGGGESAPLTQISQGSMYPWRQEVLAPGDLVGLSCRAPYGARITAEVDGEVYELTANSAAREGEPVTYTGTARLSPGPSDATTGFGRVLYRMEYQGQATQYESTGELFVVGPEAALAVEVTDMRGDTSAVNYAPDFRDNMLVSVEQGARDYVVDSSPSFFKLSCGGWVSREDVTILTGKNQVDTALSLIQQSVELDSKGLTISIPSTGRPYYISQYHGDRVEITFYNTSIDGALPGPWEDDGLISDVQWSYDSQANSSHVVLTSSGGRRLWGYNVEFGDGALILRVKSTPKLSDTPGKPLEGVTIIVDAGHGGNDPGALGVAGRTGPTESQLNYINACFAAIHLQQLGATVHMTQTQDERLSYAQRMDIARDSRADFYLSFHHNSTGENVDSTNAKGVEVYYIEDLARPFAENIAGCLTAATGRRNRGAMFATFRVTQMTHTPSLLVELGFVVSPQEYEALCQPLNIYRAALGVSQGILQTIRQAQNGDLPFGDDGQDAAQP